MSEIVLVESQVAETVETVIEQTVLTSDESSQVIETQDETVIVTHEPSVEVLVSVEQGPAGPPGIPEEEMPYSKRTDFASESLIYRGEAAPGSEESSPVWRIRRLTISVDDDVTEEWADGDANFDNVWADRIALNYR